MTSHFKSAEAEKLLVAFKKAAKSAKKNSPPDKPLAWYLDKIATAFGYLNWSLLHKDVATFDTLKALSLREKAIEHPELEAFLAPRLDFAGLDVEAATEEMRDYAKKHFTPLHDFALYDNESETGYAWPEVELEDELQAEFSGKFPDELINSVAAALFLEYGYWGVEDYGRDEED